MSEVFLIAGEASADHHAAKIVRRLKERGIASFGMGGDQMVAAGFEPVAHASEMSVMGLFEVIRQLPRILGVMKRLHRSVETRKPKVALLLDLPDFNLRMARFLKKHGVYVIYYISPQLWAWRPRRAKIVARFVDEMLCVLPFEPEFYAERKVQARFVGHPLVEDLRETPAAPSEAPLLALLPGSRKQESQRLLPVMLAAAEALAKEDPRIGFVVPLGGTTSRAEVEAALLLHPSLAGRVRIVDGHAQEVLAEANGAAVASGTATLEAALVGVPFVAIYKMSGLSYWLARRIIKAASVIKVGSIVLANLILGELRIKELLQSEADPVRIAGFLRRTLAEPALKISALQTRADLLERLGEKNATEQVTASVEAAMLKTRGA